MTEAVATIAETARPDPGIVVSGRSLSVGTKTYLYVSMSIVAAIVIIPLLTTVLGGFKTIGNLRGDPFGLPAVWQWHNYGDILFSQRYWLQMGNSLLIAGLTGIEGVRQHASLGHEHIGGEEGTENQREGTGHVHEGSE